MKQPAEPCPTATADDASDTLIAPLRSLLPGWGLPGDAPLRLLSVSENRVYLAGEGSEKPLVLRVHRPGNQSVESIESELAWVGALRRDGVVDTPAPLIGADGASIGQLHHGAGSRHVVAFEYRTGQPPQDRDLPAWFARIGAASARLHAHVRRWSPPAGFVRGAWSADTMLGPRARWGDWHGAPGIDREGTALLERLEPLLLAGMHRHGQSPDNFGLIHADMRPANLLVEGDNLCLIDFDDCGLGWFAFDFAGAITFMEHDPRVPEFLDAWLTGYRTVAPIAAAEVAALPMFIMARRMQLTAWMASHPDAEAAIELGAAYGAGTVVLGEAYLTRLG